MIGLLQISVSQNGAVGITKSGERACYHQNFRKRNGKFNGAFQFETIDVVQFRTRLRFAGSAGALARTMRAARRFLSIKFYLAFEKHRLRLGRARAPALPVASSPTPQIELVHKPLLFTKQVQL